MNGDQGPILRVTPGGGYLAFRLIASVSRIVTSAAFDFSVETSWSRSYWNLDPRMWLAMAAPKKRAMNSTVLDFSRCRTRVNYVVRVVRFLGILVNHILAGDIKYGLWRYYSWNQISSMPWA